MLYRQFHFHFVSDWQILHIYFFKQVFVCVCSRLCVVVSRTRVPALSFSVLNRVNLLLVHLSVQKTCVEDVAQWG